MSSDEDSPGRGREKFTNERTYSEDIDNTAYREDPPEEEEEEEEEGEEESFGPALPPHLIAKNRDKSDGELDDEDPENEVYGPCLPKPETGNDEKSTSGESEGDGAYGPQLPSSMKKKKKRIIGPEVPADFLPSNDEEMEEEEEEEEEDAEYGPSPKLMVDPRSDTSSSSATAHLFRTRRPESSEAVAKRETWMLELPPERAANLGLGTRRFKTKLGDDKDRDRSGWTETPETRDAKKKKPDPKDDAMRVKQKGIRERDEEIERLARKAEKKRKRKEESLLEMHRKKMEKKARKEARKLEKSGKPPERRPFDRNIDLQVNRFDESQKRAVIKKAQLLNDRFARGESKYL